MIQHSLFKRDQTHHIQVQTIISVDPLFLDDVICTAVEGGIGYWSQVEKYKWDNMAGPGFTFADIIDIAEDYDEDEDGETTSEPPPRYKVDNETIHRALTLLGMANGGMLDTMYVSESFRSDIIQAMMEKDTGEIDANMADSLVQIGLFGRVKYG